MALSAIDKARGGVYTPTPIARFLADWAIRGPNDSVLEPAAGDGAFLQAATARLIRLGCGVPAAQIHAVELDPSEAARCRASLPGADVRVLDFLSVDPSQVPPIAAVVGNPPYIRYQAFSDASRDLGLTRGRQQGVQLSKMASSWAHFVVHACSFLEQNGRLALVLPAELLTAQYSEPVWDLLTRRFRAVSLIAFDDPAFRGVQVDAVLLLADQGEPPAQRVLRLPNIAALADLEGAWRSSSTPVSGRRWAHLFDEDAEAIYAQLVATESCRRLGDIASVDIGVVTGANAFFILSTAELRDLSIPLKYTLPILEKARDVPGLSARRGDAKRLLQLNAAATEAAAVARYIDEGVRRRVNEGYKCSLRRPWYRVPLPKAHPHAFLPYMAHVGPRLVVRTGLEWSSNLLHGVALAEPGTARGLAVAMLSSVTQLSAEIQGRSYGGGVLKLEPSEAEQLLVPEVNGDTRSHLEALFPVVDRLVRDGRHSEATALVDQALPFRTDQAFAATARLRARRFLRARRGEKAKHATSPDG